MRREATTADHVIEHSEVARAVQAVQHAIEAAIADALQGQQQKQQRQKKLAAPPPASEVEQQIVDGPTKPPPRERHGFRGTPPPADFSLAELPDDSLLTEHEVASLARVSISTLTGWRKRERDHPLPWVKLRGRRIRYAAGDVRRFIASGDRPQVGRPRKKDENAAPAPRRRTAAPRAEREAAR